MNPVRGYTMLNFIHWLAVHRPDIRRLSDQPEEVVLDLVNKFEGGKLRGNDTLKDKWRIGFDFLLKGDFDWEGYGEARRELARLEGRGQ